MELCVLLSDLAFKITYPPFNMVSTCETIGTQVSLALSVPDTPIHFDQVENSVADYRALEKQKKNMFSTDSF